MRYAIFLVIFILILSGAYYTGYKMGSADTKIEYVTKEVVKYVEVNKAKSTIYSSANINRDTILRMYTANKF